MWIKLPYQMVVDQVKKAAQASRRVGLRGHMALSLYFGKFDFDVDHESTRALSAGSFEVSVVRDKSCSVSPNSACTSQIR
jgi:hypothetical protein